MLIGKAMTIHLTAELTKNILYKMSQYSPKPYEPSEKLIYLITKQKQI